MRDNKKQTDVRRLTRLSLFTAVALALYVVESWIPVLIPIPGIKLGLANIITLFLISRYNLKDALLVLVVRIILGAVFAGQAMSFIYSLCGGTLCFIFMGAVNRFLSGRYIFITSIIGAIGHNAGQIFAAYFILKMSGIFAYLPILMLSAIVTGLFTGLVCEFMCRYIPDGLT